MTLHFKHKEIIKTESYLFGPIRANMTINTTGILNFNMKDFVKYLKEEDELRFMHNDDPEYLLSYVSDLFGIELDSEFDTDEVNKMFNEYKSLL